MRDLKEIREGTCWADPEVRHRRSADFTCRFFEGSKNLIMSQYKEFSCEDCMYWAAFNEELN